jgi:hypothetical protein
MIDREVDILFFSFLWFLFGRRRRRRRRRRR